MHIEGKARKGDIKVNTHCKVSIGYFAETCFKMILSMFCTLNANEQGL